MLHRTCVQSDYAVLYQKRQNLYSSIARASRGTPSLHVHAHADREEGGIEGAEALDEMIAAVGLKGGSAVKVRKRLMASWSLPSGAAPAAGAALAAGAAESLAAVAAAVRTAGVEGGAAAVQARVALPRPPPVAVEAAARGSRRQTVMARGGDDVLTARARDSSPRKMLFLFSPAPTGLCTGPTGSAPGTAIDKYAPTGGPSADKHYGGRTP